MLRTGRDDSELEHQVRLLDTALSWIADYVFICDLQGRILYANRARLQFWHRELTEVLGKTFFELDYPHELAARIHAQIETVIATREPLHTEAEYTPASGKTGYYDYIFVPVFGKDGEVEAVAGSTRDISDRHREQIAQRKAETALWESKELFRITLYSIGDAVIATESTGHVTFMNSVAERLTGWTFAEAAGKASSEVFRIVNEQTRAEAPSPIDRVLKEGIVVGLANHTVVLARDGEEYPIEDSGAPIRDEAGNLQGVVLVFRDVTENRRKEQALRLGQERSAHLVAIVQSSHDAILSKDLQGIITSWNPAAERIYGYTAQEIIGKSKSLLIPAEMPEELPNILRKIRAGEHIEQYETVRVRKDGTRIHLSLSVSPVHDAHGNIIGASTIARDLTERLQHLREIEALNVRLKRSIQETHHRVKNNLQVISALAELQLEDNQSMVPASALVRVGQHTRNLAAVHDLLTQESKTDAHIDSISTRAALDKLIPLLQSTTGGRRIAYEADDFRMSVREGASLALLISELVSNAVKHGRTDIEITLTREGDRARLEVCDDGQGFPPGFDWRTAANTGLELIDSTCRHDLQGVIAYGNRPEGGARVVITFPIPPT